MTRAVRNRYSLRHFSGYKGDIHRVRYTGRYCVLGKEITLWIEKFFTWSFTLLWNYSGKFVFGSIYCEIFIYLFIAKLEGEFPESPGGKSSRVYQLHFISQRLKAENRPKNTARYLFVTSTMLMIHGGIA